MYRRHAWVLLVAMSGLLSTAAHAGEWHWMSLSSGIDRWHTREGAADVTMSQGRLDAMLRDGQERAPAYRIEGKMVHNRISATATLVDSDVGPFTLTGEHKTERGAKGGGREPSC